MSAPSETLWRSVDRLLAGAEIDGIRAHKLGALEARRLRRLGQAVPPALAHDERAAKLATMLAVPLLKRIRASCEGPLILFKGPEVAARYPERARLFADVDLLVPDADAVHRSLRSAGFVEAIDPDVLPDHHHLMPLEWPELALTVEVHRGLLWPAGASPPTPAEILDDAVPSEVGVDGILAPAPGRHAVILATHGWVHEPLRRLRDLVDVSAVALGSADDELERIARAWGVSRIWRTTSEAAASVFDGRGRTAAVAIWGRHLPRVRERTVLDNHLQRWLHRFWEQSFGAALAGTMDALRQELLPDSGEPWRDKLIRVAHAARHPNMALSSHETAWRDAAARRRQGNGEGGGR